MTMRYHGEAFFPSDRAFRRSHQAREGQPPTKALHLPRFRLEAAGLGLAFLGLGIGAWFLWRFGGLLALLLACFAWFLSWRSTSKAALPPGAMPLPYARAPLLHDILIDVSLQAGLKRAPTLSLLDSPLPNAAAMGRPSDPHILVTTGLLAHLDHAGIRAVLAHEAAHLAHGDLFWLSALSSASSFVSALGNAAFLIILFTFPFAPPSAGALLTAVAAPVAAVAMARLLAAFSREREFAADREAARICEDGGESLARALSIVDAQPASPWEALMRRVLGVPPARRRESGPFDSHPPLEERIRRLGFAPLSAAS